MILNARLAVHMSLQQVTTNSCDMKDKPVIVEYIHSTYIHTYKFSLSFYYIIRLSVEHTPHALHGWEMMMTTLRVYYTYVSSGV